MAEFAKPTALQALHLAQATQGQVSNALEDFSHRINALGLVVGHDAPLVRQLWATYHALEGARGDTCKYLFDVIGALPEEKPHG